MTAPLGLVAVGHYLGVYPTEEGEQCCEVRLGSQIHVLDEDQAEVWFTPADDEHDPSVVESVLELGLLVVLTEGGEAELARTYRMLPLMVGLGPNADDPEEWDIGIPGRPSVTVDRLTYELWAVAGARRSLWQACESFADARRTAGEVDKRWTSPDEVLVELLFRLGELMGGGAACLDLALPGRSPRVWEG
ncbi:hypothetical protein ACWDV4_18170 [Micromonospora sp. NPDC003197]